MKISTIKQTCIACPSQWEGQLDDGRYFYARFRWGHLTFRVSDISIDNAILDGIFLLDTYCGEDSLDGYMTQDELITILRDNGILEQD